MPSDSPTRHIVGAGGLELALYHLGGAGDPVILAHANGFTGRCWAPMAEMLVPHFDVWALDMRGHGRSERDPSGEYRDWDDFALDVLAAVDQLGAGDPADASAPTRAGARPWRAVGHSLGGNAVLRAESLRPGTFVALACYEPAVLPPTPSGDDGAPDGSHRLAEGARRRRETFPSRAEARENFRAKGPFARFHPDALDAYLESGFVEEPDGSVRLACRREDEATIYRGALHNRTWDSLPGIGAPVTVLGGGSPTDPVARIAPLVAGRLPRGTYLAMPDLDHFGPMTAPAEVGRAVAGAFGVPPT